MRKSLENMTDHEILMELVAEKRRSDNLRRLKIAVYVVIAIIIAILLFKYLPPVIAFFRRLNDQVQQLQTAMEQVQQTVTKVKETVSGVGDSTLEALKRAIESVIDLINKIPGVNL